MNEVSQSTTVGGETAPSSSSRARRTMLAGLAREPLLHFLLIGALLFAAHAAITPSVSKERLIEVTPEVRQSIVELYKQKRSSEPGPDRGAEPSAEELERLIDAWILNEITYREALAQGLDKGDEMIRERIMQKMRLLIFSNVTIKDPTEEELRQWFEARRARFDIPDVLSFFAVPFAGPGAEAEARSTLAQIESGTEGEDVRARAQAFLERPRPSLESAFGKPFVDQLAALPLGKWHVLRSPAGWHIVRLDALAPGRRVEMHEISTQLINQWRDERARELGTAAIRDMAKGYVIRRGEP
jgi:hypothetical protein